jgi:hypothetical protein
MASADFNVQKVHDKIRNYFAKTDRAPPVLNTFGISRVLAQS